MAALAVPASWFTSPGPNSHMMHVGPEVVGPHMSVAGRKVMVGFTGGGGYRASCTFTSVPVGVMRRWAT